MPFYRLEKLEQLLGIPLPASTQWEIEEEAAEVIKAARDELIRQAAQGEVLHNDDTGMRVLAMAREPGLAHARRNGKRLGRPPSVVHNAIEARKLYRHGITKSEIARRLPDRSHLRPPPPDPKEILIPAPLRSLAGRTRFFLLHYNCKLL